MKPKYTIWELIIFMFAATICFILIMNVVGALVLRIPTNADNKELRLKLADMLNTMYGSLITIIGFKIKEAISNNQNS